MVILGLGSNLGDRLAQLRHALLLIQKIPLLTVVRVSPLYISDPLLPENAPASWDNKPYLNLAIYCKTVLDPLDLLHHLKKIEIDVGRKPEKDWGPRIIDIDILAWDDRVLDHPKLTIPHECLPERPFALWPLSDLVPDWIYPVQGEHFGKTAAELVSVWGSRFSGDAPLHTRQIQQRIDTSELVGIINVTPDSFSDGGNSQEVSAAIQHAHQLVIDGATVLDLGAESTAPLAKPITQQEEWQRLEPILQKIMLEKTAMLIPPKISVDTRNIETAQKALALGVDWINDVSGLTNPDMCQLLAEQNTDVVVMHQLSFPANAKIVLKGDPIKPIFEFAENCLKICDRYGIATNRIIFDVGIGFGKTPEQSLKLLQNIQQFQVFDLRLLMGHSRKSFLTLFTELKPAERDVETLTMSLYLSSQSVDYLRVHNVDACARAFKISTALVTY